MGLALSPRISGPTHQWHTYVSVSALLKSGGDQKVRGVSLAPLSWTDPYWVSFRPTEIQFLRGGHDGCYDPRRSMDLEFPKAL